MAAGDPTAWAGRFRSFDERFLERVVALWPRCLTVLPPQPDEDTITANLVNLLQRDPDTRSRFHWIEFQYEPFGYTPEGTAYSKGSVDMAVILDQGSRHVSCVRVPASERTPRRRQESLAREYVMDRDSLVSLQVSTRRIFPWGACSATSSIATSSTRP